MRKQLLMALSLVTLSCSVSAMMNELEKDINIVQPKQSKNAPHFMVVNRYPVVSNSKLERHNLVRNVMRDLGSDVSKQVNILWTDKTTKQQAEQIQKLLVTKGIKKQRIHLENQGKGTQIYPLYVEVQYLGAKKADCHFDTAEDMMSFDTYNPCAGKNNHRIQLKN
ncbi:protein RcpB [Pasteurellaceae bacterium LIM206]|nr:protein RcpB [Pasteurellaceae bacterium LIM206]